LPEEVTDGLGRTHIEGVVFGWGFLKGGRRTGAVGADRKKEQQGEEMNEKNRRPWGREKVQQQERTAIAKSKGSWPTVCRAGG